MSNYGQQMSGGYPYQRNQAPDWFQQWFGEMSQRFAPQSQQQPYQQQAPAIPYTIMPFTGDEDIKSFSVGFDGHQYFFVDKPNQKIKVKYWDKDAGRLFYGTYVMDMSPQDVPVAPLNETIPPAWATEIDRLEAKINELEGALNAKSDSNANGAKDGSAKSTGKRAGGKPTEQPKPDGDA